MTEKLDLTFYVAGVKFRKDWRSNLDELEVGERLHLEPEPTNRFDKNAVKILSELGTMLGYVPAKTGEALIVSEATARGVRMDTIIITLEPDFEPWTALEVQIVEIDNESL